MPEYDSAGNECCGQSFMGGTICSDAPGHEGGHSAACQTCNGDWINGTCVCPGIPECEWCGNNGEDVATRDEHHGDLICQECIDEHEPESVTTEELAEVYKSFGVAPPS